MAKTSKTSKAKNPSSILREGSLIDAAVVRSTAAAAKRAALRKPTRKRKAA